MEPKVVSPLHYQSHTIGLGDQLSLTCEAGGKPDLTQDNFVWRKDGALVGDQYTTEFLTIKNTDAKQNIVGKWRSILVHSRASHSVSCDNVLILDGTYTCKVTDGVKYNISGRMYVETKCKHITYCNNQKLIELQANSKC